MKNFKIHSLSLERNNFLSYLKINGKDFTLGVPVAITPQFAVSRFNNLWLYLTMTQENNASHSTMDFIHTVFIRPCWEQYIMFTDNMKNYQKLMVM